MKEEGKREKSCLFEVGVDGSSGADGRKEVASKTLSSASSPTTTMDGRSGRSGRSATAANTNSSNLAAAAQTNSVTAIPTVITAAASISDDIVSNANGKLSATSQQQQKQQQQQQTLSTAWTNGNNNEELPVSAEFTAVSPPMNHIHNDNHVQSSNHVPNDRTVVGHDVCMPLVSGRADADASPNSKRKDLRVSCAAPQSETGIAETNQTGN